MDTKNLLRKAVAAAIEEGMPLDVFADAAWQAFIDAKPGLREELETRALVARLSDLRERGLIPNA